MIGDIETFPLVTYKRTSFERIASVMEKQHIGEFEELVLLSVLKLGEGAYGVSILEALEKATGRSISVGALYATLDRLERKGFVYSWVADATPERGGRAKRYFKIEAAGQRALREAESVRRKLVPRLKPA